MPKVVRRISCLFAEMGKPLIDAMVEHAERITSPHSAALFMHLGGAPARLDPNLNAVGFRTVGYVLNVQGAWENPQEDRRHIDWAREYWAATHPHSTGDAYINFMTEDEGEARVRAAYGDQTRRRCSDREGTRRATARSHSYAKHTDSVKIARVSSSDVRLVMQYDVQQ
jgi:hypothetical protein